MTGAADNIQVVSELEKRVAELEEMLKQTYDVLEKTCDDLSDARKRADYWQEVAQGDIPWEYD